MQKFFDYLNDHGGFEWFRQIGACSTGDSPLLVIRVLFGCQHYNRYSGSAGIPLDPATDLKSVYIGQHDVK